MKTFSLVGLALGFTVNSAVLAGVVAGVTFGGAPSVDQATAIAMAGGANPKLAKTRILYYQQARKIDEAIGILKNDKQARSDSPARPSDN